MGPYVAGNEKERKLKGMSKENEDVEGVVEGVYLTRREPTTVEPEIVAIPGRKTAIDVQINFVDHQAPI